MVSAVTVRYYGDGINAVLFYNLLTIRTYTSIFSFFTDKDIKPELAKQEKTMVAISLLVVVFSLIEIALAVASARSSDSCYQTPQENQVSQLYQVIDNVFSWKKLKSIAFFKNTRPLKLESQLAIDLKHNDVKQCFCGSIVHCGCCSHA